MSINIYRNQLGREPDAVDLHTRFTACCYGKVLKAYVKNC